VIDQLEELFTAYPERWADRPAFFEDLAGALRDDPLLRVVLSIREDFLAQLDPYARLLPDGLRARYRLERLSAGAALRAAKAPARRAGRPFADGVAEQLVQDLQKVRLDTELGPKEVVASTSSRCNCRSRAAASGRRCPSRRPRSPRSTARSRQRRRGSRHVLRRGDRRRCGGRAHA